MARKISDARVIRRRKGLAIVAAGLVVGLGASVTLAVWNDSEWVTAGIDNNADGVPDVPGLGTSSFEVQQNVSTPYVDTAYADRETNPGGALTFSLGALALSPGSAVYAPVSLRTAPGSLAAASLALSGATTATGITTADTGGLLFSNLQLRVVSRASLGAVAPAACDSSAFGAGASYVVGTFAAPAALNTAGTGSVTLAAGGAGKADYCFQVSLPANAPQTLQGRTVAPAWNFIATSV